MSIFEKLETLAANSSTNKKKELIIEYFKDTDFQRMCVYALDPFKTYGLSKVESPSKNLGEDGKLWGEAFSLLDALSLRTITGNTARDAVYDIMTRMSKGDSVVFERILKGDLRCGVGTTLINGLFPKHIPEFDVMLAGKWNAKKAVWPAIIQPKFDGLRCVVMIKGDDVKFLSRGGKEFDTLGCLIPEIIRVVPKNIRFGGLMLDAEVVSTRGDFQQTCSDVKRGEAVTDEVALMIFDGMGLDYFKFESCPHSQVVRSAGIEKMFNGEVKSDRLIAAPYTTVANEEEATKIYEQYRAQGYEGAIVKNPDGMYEFKRSNNWMKMKPQDNVDLEIVDSFEGTGKYEGMLGGFDVMFEGVKCSVGGGFSDEQRKEFWTNRDEMIGQIIEVQYMEKTADGAMRHPRFICVRSFKGAKA